MLPGNTRNIKSMPKLRPRLFLPALSIPALFCWDRGGVKQPKFHWMQMCQCPSSGAESMSGHPPASDSLCHNSSIRNKKTESLDTTTRYRLRGNPRHLTSLHISCYPTKLHRMEPVVVKLEAGLFRSSWNPTIEKLAGSGQANFLSSKNVGQSFVDRFPLFTPSRFTMSVSTPPWRLRNAPEVPHHQHLPQRSFAQTNSCSEKQCIKRRSADPPAGLFL